MNRAEYIDHMGDDLRVVNAARVSFNKESDWEDHDDEAKLLGAGNAKLIKYLAEHGHWTPFSHPQITMRETVPIFVARQRFKHMVGFTYNEVSRRYVDDTPEFFKPDRWRGGPTDGAKQGSSGSIENEDASDCWGDLHFHHQNSISTYQAFLDRGVAPEQARMLLPQSMVTSYYVTGSLAAWARAYKQRIDPHSQQEIQDLAGQWGSIIEPLFPESWKALCQTTEEK